MSALKDRIQAALELDPKILVDSREVENTQGFTVEHFESLGLREQDLKKLCRHGLAVRGYLGRKDGYRVRYVLVADRGNDAEV